MTPALREAVHQSIRTSQVEMPINELFQPIFDASPSCTYCAHCAHCAQTFNIKIKTPLARLRKCHLWGEYARYIVIN
jgi:transposase-like protein